MKKIILLAAITVAFTSCQKEDIQPNAVTSNETTTLWAPQLDEAIPSISEVNKKEEYYAENYVVEVYHFFNSNQVSGTLEIQRVNGSTDVVTFDASDLQSGFFEGIGAGTYLKTSVILSHSDIVNSNGWFNTNLLLDQTVGVIRNENYFNGEIAQRSESPIYCGINPVTTVHQANQLSTSFWVDFSEVSVITEGAGVTE